MSKLSEQLSKAFQIHQGVQSINRDKEKVIQWGTFSKIYSSSNFWLIFYMS